MDEIGGLTQSVNIANEKLTIDVSKVEKSENEMKMDIAIKIFANTNFSSMTINEIVNSISNVCKYSDLLYNAFVQRGWI